MNEIDEKIVETINSHDDWTKNQKIRYAYIELGKNVYLNYKFFYSLYQVLDKENTYSLEEIIEIYNKVNPVDAAAICRDCSIRLQNIFDKCGIRSRLLEMIKYDTYDVGGTNVDIYHTFICAEGDDNKRIFMKLLADLPLIQLGLETKHFGYKIDHTFKRTGKLNYRDSIIEEQNREKRKGLDLSEPKNSEIKGYEITEKELRKLDESLGYVNLIVDNKNEYLNVIFNMMRDSNQKYKEYIYQLSTRMDNEFYKGLVELISDDSESLSVDLSRMSFAKWDEVKKYICISIKNKINKELYEFGDSFEKNLDRLLEEKDYHRYIHNLVRVLKLNKDELDLNANEFGLFALTTNADKLIDVIERLEKNTNYGSKEFAKLKSQFNTYFQKVATVFIDKKYQITYNNEFSNAYIINKIKVLFPSIFDFGHSTDFTKLHLGEKVRIMDVVLDNIFPELSKDKTLFGKKKKSLYRNRIKTFIIFDKYDNEYKMVILVDVNVNENTKAFIYNFNEGKNYFENEDDEVSLFKMKANPDRYVIMSRSLSEQARDNEEDEEKEKKR